MRGKKLSRQLKKSLDTETVEEDLTTAKEWLTTKGADAPEVVRLVFENFPSFLDTIESAYETYEQTLNQAQRNLEISGLEVEERNKLLRAENRKVSNLLNTMRQAVFTIDAKGKVVAPVSAFANIVFEKPIVGEDVFEILYSGIAEDSEEFSGIKFGIISSFGESEIQWTLSSDVFPNRVVLPNGKILKVSVNPLYDDNNLVEKILYVIEDVTEVEKLEKIMNEERARSSRKMQLIQELVSAPRSRIADFLKRTSQRMVVAQEELKQTKAVPDFDRVFRELHTIKGNARAFRMTMISGVAHRAESALSPARRTPSLWPEIKDAVLDLTNDLESTIKEYCETASDVLGLSTSEGGARNAEDSDSIGVSRSALQELKVFISELRTLSQFSELGAVEEVVTRLEFVPIRQAFQRITTMAEEISLEMGKSVTIETVDNNFNLDAAYLNLLQDVLTHLVRNSIDHGIEKPVARKSSGKPLTAKINIACKEQGGNVLLSISDDGRGIDADAVARKALSMGVIVESDLDKLSQTDRINLIFKSGLSTSSEVSEISGRGVGMDVVREITEQLGGSIRVKSEPGVGTEFTLEIPKEVLCPKRVKIAV